MTSKQNIVSKLKRIWYTMFPVVKPVIRMHIMTETKKTVKVNYTPEATAAIVAAYMLAPTKETVAELAAEFGKTTRSIVAKLSREGVYKKAEYVAKNGAKPETKEAKVEKIAKALGVAAEKLGGLEAATKVALDLILAAVTPKVESAKADETETEGNAEMA
jgi:hypothetical protein